MDDPPPVPPSLLTRLGCTRAEAIALGVLVTGVLTALGLLATLPSTRVEEPARPGAALGGLTEGADGADGGGPVAGRGAATTGGGAAGGTASDRAATGAASAGTGHGAGGGSLPRGGGSTGGSGVAVVHVAGAVAQPGVYRLALGSRVGEAVDAAGGALPEAELAGLNLARPVADGEQVLVPGPGVPSPAPAPPPDGPAQPGGPLDLNTATAEDLDGLPGVGPVLAERILEHRSTIGRFTAVDELQDVKGIGDATFAELAPLVTV